MNEILACIAAHIFFSKIFAWKMHRNRISFLLKVLSTRLTFSTHKYCQSVSIYIKCNFFFPHLKFTGSKCLSSYQCLPSYRCQPSPWSHFCKIYPLRHFQMTSIFTYSLWLIVVFCFHKVYWYLGQPNATIPKTWPTEYSTAINASSPLPLFYNTSQRALLYLSVSV